MKQIKNNILLAVLLTFSSILFSQQRGNFSHQQGQGSQMAEVNPQNMARIIMYNYEAVIKKLKIKKAPLKTVIMHAIYKHNNKINEIKTFNYETFDNVNKFITKKRNEAMLNHDFSMMKESQMQVNEMLAPIRKKVRLYKNTLNTTFEKELSEKQYKKWLKYQEAELKKLTPKAPQNQNNQQIQRNRGQQQQGVGMNRRRY